MSAKIQSSTSPEQEVVERRVNIWLQSRCTKQSVGEIDKNTLERRVDVQLGRMK